MGIVTLAILRIFRKQITCADSLLLLVLLAFTTSANAQQVTTPAGMAGSSGIVNGTGRNARFHEPYGITCDTAGNAYVADRLNHCIRKITPSGQVTTIAGNGQPGGADGVGVLASFNEPRGIACDHNGNLYIADSRNYKIRRIDINGTVTTLAGSGVFGTTNGPAVTARFGFPAGIAVNHGGTVIYVSDYNTHTIRKITGGQVYTVAGTPFLPGASDGAGSTASFNHPSGLALLAGGDLLIADEWNAMIRRMSPSGTVTTVAGNGQPGSVDGALLSARFNAPSGIDADANGNAYVADAANHTIRKLDFLTGQVSTPAGSPGQTGSGDGLGSAARFSSPSGIAVSSPGVVLVADKDNHTIRKLTYISSIVLNVAFSASNPLCEGNPVQVVATPTGLSDYILFIDNLPADTSLNGQFSLGSLPAGSHTLMISAIDQTGAIASSVTMPLNILPGYTPVITSTGGNTLCNGSTTTLSVSGATGVSWSTGATTSHIQTGTAGIYSVTATGPNGCRGTSQPFVLNVSNSPVPVIQAQHDTVCPGQTTTLTASQGTGYLWSNGATSPNIPAIPGTYLVSVTVAGGCSGISSPFTIHEYSITPPVISPSGTVLILQGDSIALQASGGVSYSWPGGTTGNTCYVNASGSYTVTAITADGCTATSTPVLVQLINSSSILTAAGPLTFCEGDSAILQSIFPAGNQWHRNGQPIPGANEPCFVAIESGWYSVVVSYNSTLLRSDSLFVNVMPMPGRPELGDTAICPGSDINLLITDPGNNTHRWFDSPINGSLLNVGASFYLSSLTQGVSVFIETESADGCLAEERHEVSIVLYPAPGADFSHAVSPAAGSYSTTFTPAYANVISWQWYFGDPSVAGNTSSDEQPVFNFPAPGLYDVSLVVTNVYGCQDSIHKSLYIGGTFPAFIPTTFTPNGDGKNDVFRVRGERYTLLEMLIYDQWGSLIYATDGAQPFWDGRVNGETVQNGTYVYRVRIADPENKYYEHSGSVSVIK